MKESPLEKFAKDFMKRLAELREEYGDSLEKKLRDLVRRHEEDLIIPPINFDRNAMVRNILRRSRRASLKAAQEFALKHFADAIRKASGGRNRYSKDFLPLLTIFQLPTGSGKTLLYSLAIHYFSFANRLFSNKRIKFVVATRSNYEGMQVLQTLYAIKLALVAFDELLGKPMEISSGKRRKTITARDALRTITTFYRGAANIPCLARILDAADSSSAFFDPTTSRRGCKRYRLMKIKDENGEKRPKCPFLPRIEAALVRVTSGVGDEDLYRVLKKLGKSCPLYYSYFSTIVADIVVTNHKSLKIAILSSNSGSDRSYPSSRSETSYPSPLLVSYQGQQELIKDHLSFLRPGGGKSRLDERMNLLKRLSNNVPTDIVVIIDEADQFLNSIHEVDELTIRAKAGMTEVRMRLDILSYLDEHKELRNNYSNLERTIYKAATRGGVAHVLRTAGVRRKKNESATRGTLEDVFVLRLFFPRLKDLLDEIKKQSKKKKNRKDELSVSKIEVFRGGGREGLDIMAAIKAYISLFDKKASGILEETIKVIDKAAEIAELEGTLSIAREGRDIIKEFAKRYDPGKYYSFKNVLYSRKILAAISAISGYDAKGVGEKNESIVISVKGLTDPSIILRSLLGFNALLFSATYDRLHLYALLETYKGNIRTLIKNQLAFPILAIIDNSGREKAFKIYTFREAFTSYALSGKGKQAYKIKERLKEFVSKPELSEEIAELKKNLKGLMLTPAKDDVKNLIDGVKAIANELGLKDENRIINLGSLERELNEIREKSRRLYETRRFNQKNGHAVRTIKDELESKLKELHASYYSFIKPLSERYLAVLSELKISGIDPKTLEPLIEATLAHFLASSDQQRRLASTDVLRNKTESGFMAVGVGSYARGFDFPDLNFVVVVRAPLPQYDKLTNEDLKYRYMLEDDDAESLYMRVLKEAGINVGKGDLFEVFRRLTALRAAVQAIGRLTRGSGTKIGLVTDGRLFVGRSGPNTGNFKDRSMYDLADKIHSEVIRELLLGEAGIPVDVRLRDARTSDIGYVRKHIVELE